MWGRCGGGVGASLPLLQVFVYNLKTTTTELIDREEFFRVFDQIQYSRRFKFLKIRDVSQGFLKGSVE